MPNLTRSYERAVSDAYLAAIEDARRDLWTFTRLAWHIVEPARPIVATWDMQTVCEHLQTITDGEIKNLLINIPPGLSKSILASVMWPVFEWIRHPHRRYLSSSHGMEISTRDTMRARDLILSPWFRRYYGSSFELKGDLNRVGRYENTKTGYRIATSVASGVTGERADRIIMDDLHQLTDAYYPSRVAAAVSHYNEVLNSRGIGELTARLVIMQRVSSHDLSYEVMRQMLEGGQEYELLILPMRYEPGFQLQIAGRTIVPDPEKDERRPGGEAEGQELLHPGFQPESYVRSQEVALGDRAQAILQQRQVEGLGSIFKKQWVRNYFQIDKGGRLDYVLDAPGGAKLFSQSETATFVTVDLAASLSHSADYTVYAAWGLTPDRDLLLLDLLRERLPGERQLPALREFHKKWRPQKILIESTAFQLSFVQRAAAIGLPVEPVRRAPGQHKELRVAPLAQLMSEGRFFVLLACDGVEPEWRNVYLDELLSFPNAPYDDMIDVSADGGREAMLGAYTLGYSFDEKLSGLGHYGYGLPFGPAVPQF